MLIEQLQHIKTYCQDQNVKWTYRLYCQDYFSVAIIIKLYITGIIMPSFK